MLATGGSDALVNLWFDSTAAEKEEAFHKEVSWTDHTFFVPCSTYIDFSH